MRSTIAPARGEADLEAVRSLFRDYVEWLAIDLTFQGFEAELAGLPGRYTPPGGDVFLARSEASDECGNAGRPIGCVALRPFDPRPGACEMKRLYVREAGRGTGTGRRLAEAAVTFATAAGYREMLLDTLPTMGAAIAVYRVLGFEPIDAYYASPVTEAVYLRKRLGNG